LGKAVDADEAVEARVDVGHCLDAALDRVLGIGEIPFADEPLDHQTPQILSSRRS